MNKIVGDVISDNFCLKKFLKKNHLKGGGVKKCKFLSLEQTQPNHSVKKQAKFEEVMKSTVQPSYIRQE